MRQNTNILRYADYIFLIKESESSLQTIMDEVVEESEKEEIITKC